MSKRKPLIIAVAIALAYASFNQLTQAERSVAVAPTSAQKLETATLAGGCFWCMEPPFEKLPGVIKTESGYTGGHLENPTYEQVSHTETGHVEAVRVTFDANVIDYEDVLQVFWRQVDPTDDGGQFVDRGTSYLSAIFTNDERQRTLAEASKKALAESGRFDQPIVTPIRDASTFYLAEDYHQDYYKKNTLKYKYYRYRSGRDAFLDEAWGEDRNFQPKRRTNSEVFVKPSVSELKESLTKIQFDVTQKDATERPFKNEFWNNTASGIYVDIVSGEPLFSSLDKFKSGTGWPSFTKPIMQSQVVEHTDYKLIWPRTEVRSSVADSHLGHVFNDGPQPTGRRYCINSAALRFVPREELDAKGYMSFAELFESETKSQ